MIKVFGSSASAATQIIVMQGKDALIFFARKKPDHEDPA
jgi:hypothetical protein